MPSCKVFRQQAALIRPWIFVTCLVSKHACALRGKKFRDLIEGSAYQPVEFEEIPLQLENEAALQPEVEASFANRLPVRCP